MSTATRCHEAVEEYENTTEEHRGENIYVEHIGKSLEHIIEKKASEHRADYTQYEGHPELAQNRFLQDEIDENGTQKADTNI